MAKILFVNPVVRENDEPRHVPYGMALLASIAEREGHAFQVFDANAWRPPDDALVGALAADRWDVIAVGGITTTYGYIKKTLRLAKRHAPQALVVAGGGFLTSMPREMMGLLPQIDVGVVGEAFVTFPEVLRKVDAGAPDWSRVLGIIWRDGRGNVHLNPERPLITDLDELPYPAWEHFPLEVYFPNSCLLMSEEGMVAKRRLDINASYGCSLICRFCFHLGITGDMEYVDTAEGQDVAFTYRRQLRWHSPRYIVDLVKHARERFGVDFVMFLDENLMTMNTSTRGRWLPEICDLWVREGLQPRCIREGVPHDPETCDGIHWSGTSHAGLVNREVLLKMREAGCSQLLYGLESFNARVLKSTGKGATPEANERAIRMTLEAGICPIPNQIIGFPDEFFDSIRDNVEAWERLGIQVKPFFATPYPGSEWYYTYKDRILEQYGGDLEAFILDLTDATNITAVICENFNAVELLGLRELMVARDLKRINEYEKTWRRLHGEPRFPVFSAQKPGTVTFVPESALLPLRPRRAVAAGRD